MLGSFGLGGLHLGNILAWQPELSESSRWLRLIHLSVIPKIPGHKAFSLYHYMVFINLLWGLVNLLPILPLDGGRVARSF